METKKYNEKIGIISHKTEMANWHDLISIAQKDAKIYLEHDVEAYLVLLLMKFIRNNKIASSVVALEYLEAINLNGKLKEDQLQMVAEQCLLFSGLFPKRSVNKRVSNSYFINIGRSAYAYLVDVLAILKPHMSNFYYKIYENFISAMNVMLSMRLPNYNAREIVFSSSVNKSLNTQIFFNKTVH